MQYKTYMNRLESISNKKRFVFLFFNKENESENFFSDQYDST